MIKGANSLTATVQTGETYCDVPTHVKKLIILAIIALIVASVLSVLFVVFCSKYIPYF